MPVTRFLMRSQVREWLTAKLRAEAEPYGVAVQTGFRTEVPDEHIFIERCTGVARQKYATGLTSVTYEDQFSMTFTGVTSPHPDETAAETRAELLANLVIGAVAANRKADTLETDSGQCVLTLTLGDMEGPYSAQWPDGGWQGVFFVTVEAVTQTTGASSA